jgi:hypothetical protein
VPIIAESFSSEEFKAAFGADMWDTSDESDEASTAWKSDQNDFEVIAV